MASKAGEITIKATGDTADTTNGNITAIGQTIRGKTVDVEAKGDVNLLAGTNTTHITEDSKSSGWSVGASIGTTGFLGGNIGINKAKSEGLTDKATHTGTTVVGSDAVTITSEKDTNIVGSTVSGNKVVTKVGDDLTITSVQDTDNYKANSKNSTLSVGFSGVGITSFTPYAGKGTTNSTYESVTNQAGIYAGTDGYDITVKDNTTLTGSVIDSKATPDKNSLTTGTLTMKDIENKASYEDSYRGIGYTYDRGFNVAEENAKRLGYATAEEKESLDNNYNKVGLVPDLGMSSKESASSMTKSAIAPGKLTVTKEPVNLNTVNRDTKNSLNELGKIFDKKKLEERQELAKLFAKNADEAIHQISESKGWQDGSKEKIALHTLVGGITAELGGHAFIDGGLAGGVNEAAVTKLMNAIGRDNPDMVQIASAVLGYATNKLAGKDGQAGAAVAQWGTKWNNMYDNDITEGPFLTLNDAVYAMNASVENEVSRYEENKEEFNRESSMLIAILREASVSGAEVVSYRESMYVPAQLFLHAMNGRGASQYFPLGTAASNALQQDIEFKKEIIRLGTKLDADTTVYEYTSINTSGELNYGLGHIKLALSIHKNADGYLYVEGQARDFYNFEGWGYRGDIKNGLGRAIKDGIKSIINDSGYDLQEADELVPFVYAIQLKTRVKYNE